MRKIVVLSVAISTVTLASLFAGPDSIQGDSSAIVALTGQVSSQKEGPMEGVVVGAKRDGSTMTIDVFSDEKGRYSFPAAKLEPGHYALKIRAAGYDLDSPTAVDVTAEKTTKANIKLKPTKNLAAQLSDAEWLLSAAGTDEQKAFLLNCNGCHTVDLIMRSNHSAEEFVQVFQRMSLYAPGSSPLHPQMTVGGTQRDRTRGFDAKAVAQWLASVNLSSGSTWKYPLKTLPRPKGRATHAIITEYDLPRPLAMPHDVVVDSNGVAWYSDFGEQFIGKLDPKTGKVTDYPIPLLKKGFPTGTLICNSIRMKTCGFH